MARGMCHIASDSNKLTVSFWAAKKARPMLQMNHSCQGVLSDPRKRPLRVR